MTRAKKRTKTQDTEQVPPAEQRRLYAIRQWFNDAHNTDADVRKKSIVRLQLQLKLRRHRQSCDEQIKRREIAKAEGTMDEVNGIDERLRLSTLHRTGYETMLRQGGSNSKRRELVREWYKNPQGLEALLGSVELDEVEDFPDAPTLQDCGPTLSHTRFAPTSAQGLTFLPIYRPDSGSTLTATERSTVEESQSVDKEDRQADTAHEQPNASSTIWNQHHYFMVKRCIAIGMTLSMAATKLAVQKQSFDRHARLELEAFGAHAITDMMTADKSRNVTEDEKLMRTHEVRTHGLWELTSTRLWKDLEGADCWNLPRWTPGGHVHVDTIDSLSSIHFDFGHRTLNVGGVALPKHVHAHPMPLKFRCFETATDVFVGITFLAQDFIKVHIPALAIEQMDRGCNPVSLRRNVVELVGICVEGSV
jgi:hypothetical protein